MGGLSTFDQLSRILCKALPKIRLGSCAQLGPKASKLQQAAFCWGLPLQRLILLRQSRQRFPPTNFSLRALCADCRQMHTVHHFNFLSANHAYTKPSQEKPDFRDLHREAFAEDNIETNWHSPSCLNTRTYRTTPLVDII